MHVTHNLRPFVNKIRYAPEVASRPERIEKDLANAKALAAILEVEAEKLRVSKPQSIAPKTEEGLAPTNSDTDSVMAAPEVPDEEEPEPKERGSDAVERRIEKIMADMRSQGLVNVDDEKTYEAKKVCDLILVLTICF